MPSAQRAGNRNSRTELFQNQNLDLLKPLTVELRRQLRFLRRDDAPAARSIDIYMENAKLTVELAAIRRTALAAKTENGSDVTKNFDLNVRGVDKLVGVA